jgi:putative FmdB family regulatory protein
MPMYTYQCEKCGVRFDRRQSFSARPLAHCPECRGTVRRLLQPASIVFKGSGWYCTDSKKKPADKTESG